VTGSHDDWDQHWTNYAESASKNPAPAYRRRLIVDLLAADGAPSRIVDIGSGSGDLALDLRERFPDAELLGIELSQHGVDMAVSRVTDATFIQRDLLQGDPPPPRFAEWATHAVCSEVLEHVDDPVALLRNALPYLAPGCRLIVTVPGGPMSAFDHHLGHRHHYRPSLVRETVEAAGFYVDEAAGAGFPFFNLYRLAVILRGKRLVEEASSEGGQPPRLALGLMKTFGFLFRFNLRRTRFGWQVVAVAHTSN
jgi:SAM-dependent methyltransferase